ncbi:transposase family protein [Streptomyces sp. S8]|uniref:transposase family protein n=1 Tax=Streptomyces sp. S8 TaxID=1837283 RepID=UPI001EF1276E|nr:transposase family protein [Streptomyces sp. S8]
MDHLVQRRTPSLRARLRAARRVRGSLLAQPGADPAVRLKQDHRTLRNSVQLIIDGTEIRVRRPAAGRKDRDKFISGKNKQNAVKSMVVTDAEGRALWCSPARPASCADITHARQLGLVRLLADGPAVEILPMPATRALARRPAAGW